jgi:large subunit ribosomal protein L13
LGTNSGPVPRAAKNRPARCNDPVGQVEFRAFPPPGGCCAGAGQIRCRHRHLPENAINPEPLIMKTYSAKPADIRRDWYLVDATGQTLGRLSTEIARRLRGKHKPMYTPHADTGDYIVVVNAEKVRVTGNKLKDKMYHHHTGYIGNLKSISLEKQLKQHPERVIEHSVKGMLPKGPLGRQMMSKLRIFAGAEHTHTAQQPIPLELKV